MIDMYVNQIYTAIKCLHQNKIIHRNIKPGNVIYNNNDGFRLTDFTSSCYKECNYNYNPFYIPWYLVNQIKHYGNNIPFDVMKRVDYFAFGVTLYQMVNKKYPFYIEKFPSTDDIINYYPQHIKSKSEFSEVNILLDKILSGDNMNMDKLIEEYNRTEEDTNDYGRRRYRNICLHC